MTPGRSIPNPHPSGRVNSEMLIVARESRGRTQKDVADAANVTQGLVSKAENGVGTIAAADLAVIAKFLDYPERLFYEPGRLREAGSACLYHRKRKTLPAKILRQLNARMNVRSLNMAKLFNGLDVDGDRMFYTLDPDEYRGSPVEVARALRAAWRLPEAPISNLTALIESAGGIVVMEDFGTHKLFGMSCWTPHGRPLFFLNSAMPTAELRWTMAHELGHLTMHGAPPSDDPESQADAFAGEFLAPQAVFRHHVRRLDFNKLPALKAHWRITMKAVIKRAQVIGAIEPGAATRLYKQHSARGYNTAEPYPVAAEPPTLPARAIGVHLRDHDYSRAELAQALMLSPSEFSRDFLGEADAASERNVVSLFAAPSHPSNA
jgi:Zn-dependent peptidase ImmA (M78 family)